MKRGIFRIVYLLFFLGIADSAHAQSAGLGLSPNLVVGLAAFLFLILLVVIMIIADRLIRFTSQQLGVENSGENFSIFPQLREIFSPKTGDFVPKSNVINLKKGFDLNLKGDAEAVLAKVKQPATFAVRTDAFRGLSPIPKVVVEVDDEVKAGDVLFFDKKNPDVKYLAPVSGKILAINRAAKRRISDIVIAADNKVEYKELEKFDLSKGSREELVAYLQENGAWPLIKQRPFGIIPETEAIPKNIFISTFDSGPLAPDADFVIKGKEKAFQKGLDVLAKLTPGKVHLGLNAKADLAPSTAFTEAANVEKHWFAGKHPVGNVGIQIHHIDPINKGDTVWTMDIQDVALLGNIFLKGKYVAERVIAITGAELNTPHYVKTHMGANVSNFLKDNLKHDHVRVVAGDALTGKKINPDGFLRTSDDQITVLKEGDEHELFGWLLALAPRPSASNAFPSISNFKYTPTTNTRGEERAFVVTGQYEKVLPMDIYPQHLMKAILVNDLERMEGLGIYELEEEDIAICEFACTSKQNLQEILREGLDLIQDQG